MFGKKERGKWKESGHRKGHNICFLTVYSKSEFIGTKGKIHFMLKKNTHCLKIVYYIVNFWVRFVV